MIETLNRISNNTYQNQEATAWRLSKVYDGVWQSFIQRIIKQNADDTKQIGLGLNPNTFLGSLGAVDGTYSIRPAFTKELHEPYDNNTVEGPDRMYSEYTKEHAFKSLVLCSHGLSTLPKLLLLLLLDLIKNIQKLEWHLNMELNF